MKKEYEFSGAKRGPVRKNTGKTRITIYLDNDVIEGFRARGDSSGTGYQTLINKALRQCLEEGNEPIDEAALRRILREELKKAG